MNSNNDEIKKILYELLSPKKIKNEIKTMTLGEYYNLYLNYISIFYSKSYYRQNLSTYKHLASYNEKMLKHIDKDLAEKIIHKIKRTASRSINAHIRNLKTAFNKAIEWDYLTENPFEEIKRRGATKRRANISHDDFNRLFTSMFKEEIIRSIASFSYYSGLRIGEVANLKWKDIDLENETLKIGSRETGTNKKLKQRVIPFNVAMELSIGPFRRNRDKFEYVFCKKDGFPYSNDYITKKFKRACRDLKLDENIKFDSLRNNLSGREGN